MTPSTSASPTPTGNATASPAMSMAATSRMFDRLKITPPRNAEPSHLASACCRSARKPRPPLPRAAHGERQHQRQQEHADGVVPVEELEPPFLAGQLLGVGPRAPAQHRDDAHHHGDRIRFNDNHDLLLSLAKRLQLGARGECLLRVVAARRHADHAHGEEFPGRQPQRELLARLQLPAVGRGRGGIVGQLADGLPRAALLRWTCTRGLPALASNQPPSWKFLPWAKTTRPTRPARRA